jgi:hypothetical protein
MIKSYLPVFALIGLTFLISCSSSEYTLKSTGDVAIGETRNNLSYTGELLTIQDSTVYLVLDRDTTNAQGERKREVASIYVSDIKSIQIEGYTNRSWLTWVLLFEALPSALFTIEAEVYDHEFSFWGFLILQIPTLLTYVFFEASTPPTPGAADPITPVQLVALRKYTRFPQGLTPTQMGKILELYDQKEIRQLK